MEQFTQQAPVARQSASWRDEYLEALQFEPGMRVRLTFLDEGEKWIPHNPQHKEAVVFLVDVSGERYRWYVRSVALLKAIKALGKALNGIEVEVTREGDGLDTEWKLEKVEE